MSWHSRLGRFTSALLLSCAMAGAARGATGSVTPAQRPDWPAAAIHALSQKPTADAQATAAVLAYEADNYGDGHPSLAQLQQLQLAAKLAPQAPDLAALSMLWCGDLPSHCNVEASAMNLRRVAPGNSLGWLPALQTAIQQNQSGAVTSVLQHMAAARHFTLYLGEWMRRIDAALQALPPPGTPMPVKDSDGGRLWQAAFASRALFPPDFGALVQACRPRNAAFVARHDACRAVGGQLQRSDGFVAVSVGLMLLRRTAPTASAYRQALTETLQWKWLLNGVGRRLYQVTRACLAADRCAHAIDDLKAVMRVGGHSIAPPAGWPTGIRVSEFTQHADEKAGVPSRLLVTHDYAAYLHQWCRRLPADLCSPGCPCKSPA